MFDPRFPCIGFLVAFDVTMGWEQAAMKWTRTAVMLGAVLLAAGAWRAGSWHGLALLCSGLVLWLMLHYARLLAVMKRASERPIGYTDSAVMLNAKLQTRQSLLHVLAMTRSLGERVSPADVQPEVYQWSDAGQARVIATFDGGRLVHWRLERPPSTADAAASHEA